MDNSTKLATVSQVVSDLTSTLLTTTANTDNYAIPDQTYGKVALNVYQIYPKKKVYPLSGYTAITIANQMIVGGRTIVVAVNANTFFFNQQIRLVNNNPVKIDIEYVDNSGNLGQVKYDLLYGGTSFLPVNILNINRLVYDGLSDNTTNLLTYTMYTDPTTGNPVSLYRNIVSYADFGAGIITVPNGYIGIISDIYFFSAVVGDLKMHIRDLSNNIKTVHTFKNMAIFDSRYNSLGSFNYPLYAGESVYFVGGASNMGNTYVHAIVTLTAI